MIVIHNGKVVTEDQILHHHAVVIEGEYIQSIISENELNLFADAEFIDAKGGYISPGFIDIHSDYIESIVSPRPTTMMNINMSIREAEKILIGNGITTMFHSLSFYREDVFTHKPMRYPKNVQRLVDGIDATHDDLHLIRHRLHARFEIDNIHQVDSLIENIKNGKIHLLSFMDHTPGQGQYRNLEIYRDTLKGYRDITNEEVDRIIKERQNSSFLTIEKMKEIADIAIVEGLAVASHDDDHLEKLEVVRAIGTTISEFPITLDVAQKAKEMGLQTIVGAPNILIGGSHSGNLSAVEAIQNDCADILCSDYYPPALLHAVFEMNEKHEVDLHKMFMMVTLNPAKAVKIDHELGSIKVGKKADLIIIERMEDGFPMLKTSIVNGSIITTTNYRKKAPKVEVIRT